MVFCDRHFGGINYPLGGVGQIGEEMAQGVTELYMMDIQAGRQAHCQHQLKHLAHQQGCFGTLTARLCTQSPELLLLLPTLLLVVLTGITERGGHVVYKANVKEIITEPVQSSSSSSSSEAGIRATGVRLADGRTYRGKVIVSNATRWDTFEGLIGESKMPESEKLFRYARLATHLQLQDDSNRPFCWC